MRNILILVIMVVSSNLMAGEPVSNIVARNIPNYLQKTQILDALNSINSGESVEITLNGNGFAFGDTFYKLNPAGYLICNSGITGASEEAKKYATMNAEVECKEITGIGEITKVGDSKETCWVEDGAVGNRLCECSSAVETICKITKP